MRRLIYWGIFGEVKENLRGLKVVAIFGGGGILSIDWGFY